MKEDLSLLKYTILRRAICTNRHSGHQTNLNYSREELENLCYEIEGKDINQLKEIHKKWIGY